MWWRQHYLQVKYLFIDTYKDATHCRVMVLARVLHSCIIFENSNFYLNLSQRTSLGVNLDLWDQKWLPLSFTSLTTVYFLAVALFNFKKTFRLNCSSMLCKGDKYVSVITFFLQMLHFRDNIQSTLRCFSFNWVWDRCF